MSGGVGNIVFIVRYFESVTTVSRSILRLLRVYTNIKDAVLVIDLQRLNYKGSVLYLGPQSTSTKAGPVGLMVTNYSIAKDDTDLRTSYFLMLMDNPKETNLDCLALKQFVVYYINNHTIFRKRAESCVLISEL